MPEVEFFYLPESPPSRAVEMVANIAGVTLNKHYVNLFTKEHESDSFGKINPLHKIPVIVDGDLTLNESRAINAYLVNRYMPEDNTLYPKDPVKRAQVDALLYMDLGVLFYPAARLLAPRLHGQFKDLDPAAEKILRDGLKYLNDRLKGNGGKKFVLGDDFTIADISVAVTLTFIQCFSYDMSEFTNITPYLDNLRASIPKYSEINDEPLKNLKGYIDAKQAGSA